MNLTDLGNVQILEALADIIRAVHLTLHFVVWQNKCVYPIYYSRQSSRPILRPLLNHSPTYSALAQKSRLFGTAEEQAKTIFGQYIDQGIIDFLFGMLRIVVWVSSVGFVFFAIYQAQRGEQWQPLLQNAFIIIAAVVVVEGLSQLFFGV